MHALWIVFLFAVGACVGSFLNVVIWRLPRGESIVFPSSHCPTCGQAIRWYDNIPIVSWLLLRARCRACGSRISGRYIVIELLTAVVVSGLYVAYFVLDVRDGAGTFRQAWPMYVAHAALLCGLLACSAVDVELFIVPLPVMWFCAAAGIVAAAARPHAFLPPASPTAAAVAGAAVLGLIVAAVLQRYGYIRESFIDADDRPAGDPDAPGGANVVAITARHGVNPRAEVLRELLFLAPAVVLAAGAYVVAARVPAIAGALDSLIGQGGGRLGRHLASGFSAVVGLLVGVAWIWGTRIAGTLAFGKEAMGMGDVHILAGVGAVAGWKVATLTFFAAPLFGLAWAVYLALARGRRELPYGPWLALGALFVLLFYDGIVGLIAPPA